MNVQAGKVFNKTQVDHCPRRWFENTRWQHLHHNESTKDKNLPGMLNSLCKIVPSIKPNTKKHILGVRNNGSTLMRYGIATEKARICQFESM